MRLAWTLAAFSVFLAVVSSPTLTGAKPATGFTFTFFDAPGALHTEARGINDRGVIVGNALVGPGWRIFVRSRDGSSHFLNSDLADIGGIGPQGVLGEDPFGAGINNRGDIVGQFFAADGRFHGFLRDRIGVLTVIDFPGALFTTAHGVNDRGQIVGTYHPDSTGQEIHGYLRERDGTFIQIDYPGATLTIPTGINNSGEVVGQYFIIEVIEEEEVVLEAGGFVRRRSGEYVRVDHLVMATNDRGDILLSGPPSVIRRNGSVAHLELPPDVPCNGNCFFPHGTNNTGVVVGQYADANGVHGFVARR